MYKTSRKLLGLVLLAVGIAGAGCKPKKGESQAASVANGCQEERKTVTDLESRVRLLGMTPRSGLGSDRLTPSVCTSFGGTMQGGRCFCPDVGDSFGTDQMVRANCRGDTLATTDSDAVLRDACRSVNPRGTFTEATASRRASCTCQGRTLVRKADIQQLCGSNLSTSDRKSRCEADGEGIWLRNTCFCPAGRPLRNGACTDFNSAMQVVELEEGDSPGLALDGRRDFGSRGTFDVDDLEADLDRARAVLDSCQRGIESRTCYFQDRDTGRAITDSDMVFQGMTQDECNAKLQRSGLDTRRFQAMNVARTIRQIEDDERARVRGAGGDADRAIISRMSSTRVEQLRMAFDEACSRVAVGGDLIEDRQLLASNRQTGSVRNRSAAIGCNCGGAKVSFESYVALADVNQEQDFIDLCTMAVLATSNNPRRTIFNNNRNGIGTGRNGVVVGGNGNLPSGVGVRGGCGCNISQIRMTPEEQRLNPERARFNGQYVCEIFGPQGMNAVDVNGRPVPLRWETPPQFSRDQFGRTIASCSKQAVYSMVRNWNPQSYDFLSNDVCGSPQNVGVSDTVLQLVGLRREDVDLDGFVGQQVAGQVQQQGMLNEDGSLAFTCER
jgi:hypothetical protein